MDHDPAASVQAQPPRAFLKQWPGDPYAVRRTAALSWLGDRYLFARHINTLKRK
jgi:hypothetical protein